MGKKSTIMFVLEECSSYCLIKRTFFSYNNSNFFTKNFWKAPENFFLPKTENVNLSKHTFMMPKALMFFFSYINC